jgi:hypothetical protein
MDIRAQKIFALSGPISMAMVLFAAYMSGFLSPPSPTATAEQIATLYQANAHAITSGAILFELSTALFVLFIAVLSVQIRRIEGDRRTFTYAQIVAGTASMAPVILGPLGWAVGAFRPESGNVQAFNDLSFLILAGVTPPATAQMFVVGLAILSDKRAQPILPRWAGYVSIVISIVAVQGLLCWMFKTGPFAWDGFLAGSLPTLLFFPWSILMAVVLIRAINREAQEAKTLDKEGAAGGALVGAR